MTCPRSHSCPSCCFLSTLKPANCPNSSPSPSPRTPAYSRLTLGWVSGSGGEDGSAQFHVGCQGAHTRGADWRAPTTLGCHRRLRGVLSLECGESGSFQGTMGQSADRGQYVKDMVYVQVLHGLLRIISIGRRVGKKVSETAVTLEPRGALWLLSLCLT